MHLSSHSRLFKMLISCAILGSVAGWLYPKRNQAFAAFDCYSTGCGTCGNPECPKTNKTLNQLGVLTVSAAALYQVNRYRQRTHPGQESTRMLSLWDVTLSKNEEFSQIAKILRNSEETQDYQQNGPYTVFWPTDTALLRTLGAERVAALQQAGEREEARNFIASLTVTGSYSLQKLRKLATRRESLTTLTRGTITLTSEDGRLMVNGVELLQTEYPARNGFVLVTNGLLTSL